MNKININKGRNLMKTMAAVVLVGMSTAGCVDMDLSPNGKPAEGNVWSTPTLAEQTIAGVYNQLYVDYSDVANGWFDIWSSTMDYGIGIAPTFNFLFATNSPSSVKGSSAPWQRFYKGIIKANDVIGNLPTVEGFDETKRSRYISECMFLRCWWYYRLNILYNGNIGTVLSARPRWSRKTRSRWFSWQIWPPRHRRCGYSDAPVPSGAGT